MNETCTYCGSELEIEREHVLPATFLGYRSFNPEEQWIVPACKTCNKYAGEVVFFSIPEKAKYIKERYEKKFARVLNIPTWSPEELKGMSRNLKDSIEEGMIFKGVIQRRIKQLERTSELEIDYQRPEWVYNLFLEWKREKEKEKRRKKQL